MPNLLASQVHSGDHEERQEDVGDHEPIENDVGRAESCQEQLLGGDERRAPDGDNGDSQ